MSNSVGWFEIYVDDIERAKNFYEYVFEVSLERLESPNPTEGEPEMWAFAADMDAYGSAGALVKMDGVAAGANSTLVYFSCLDCAVQAKRVEDLGGFVQRPKFSIGEFGFIAIVKDTEGNLIGLHSMN